MEAFSLLKYWKDTRNGGSGSRAVNPKPSATSIVSTVVNDDVSDGSDDDDGPFFDLEFAALPDDVVEEERQKVEERETEYEIDDEDEEEDEDEEIDELEEAERNMSFSPSDDLFFKGQVIQVDGPDSAPLREIEDIINAAESGNQLPLPAALVKSATKLRVFMLGLKRSKSESKQIVSHEIIHRGKNSKTGKSKFTTVRLKMEEVKVPLISLLTRAPVKHAHSDEKSVTEDGNNNSNNEEKKNRKEVVQRYLKLVKPLYVKVSKKSECEKAEEGEEKEKEKVEVTTATAKSAKARLNLRVIARKHLGKSKSAVVHTMSNVNTTSSKKSDDSLLQQQDGIQSAILHCKRSFNSSSSSEDGEEAMSVLMRSASEPAQEKVTMPAEAAGEQGRE